MTPISGWLAEPWGLAVLLLAAALAGAAGARLAAPRRPRGLAARLAALDDGQRRLAGALSQAAEAQAAGQARLAEALALRLGAQEARLGESLTETARHTSEALGRLRARLDAVDRAQARMEQVSGEVMGLRRILDDKQARGAFGEVSLMEIVSRALPPDAYAAQATLSNGRRVDCLIRLAGPPGPLPVDAKFPLEAYEAIAAAEDADSLKRARAAFRTALTGHLKAIAGRYLLPGETADQALMFVPSEAVYAEAHARFPEVVRAGMEMRVWIVSPTTLMAVLTTIRGVCRDARIAEEGGRIRAELARLARDVERMGAAAARLERHLAAAQEEAHAAARAAERAGARAARIEEAEFAEPPRAAE